MTTELEGFEASYSKDVLENVAPELEGFETNDNKDFLANIRPKKNKKKGGGFEAMGLSFPVLKGVKKRGYKIPTPIQRKTIPVALDGHDVVAMARTGSGKTACFLIPLFEKLMNSVKTPGARGLILSPTRELALQTQKFIKEIGKFTDLKSTVILGGDAMDSQFAALHENPDIIVATPGRLMHVCVEMNLKLQYIQYVVFDEADRLFEMGFGEQLQDLVKRLPDARQTLLFSATLPKMLIEFARAGLSEPALIRLDVESKIPEKLELVFLCCRTDEKIAALLFLLKQVIPAKSQTLIFAATKHHVEYLKAILDQAGVSNTCIYSTLDPSARKINAAKFQLAKVSVLIVTDVAARGIDIPQLDVVINFHFPAKPKLFVHRVGRCARAGRSGTAYSLVSCEEFPYLLDLHLFLGRPLQIGQKDCALGSIPSNVLEEEQSELLMWHNKPELNDLKRTCSNGYKAYLRARPGASMESVKRTKKLGLVRLKPHPIFDKNACGDSEENKGALLNKIKLYRPPGTIFEIGTTTNSAAYATMKAARMKHQESITKFKRKLEEKEQVHPLNTEFNLYLPKKGTNKIQNQNLEIFTGNDSSGNKKQKKSALDSDYFIPYRPADHHTEQGLMVNTFETEAKTMQLDLTGDSAEQMKQSTNQIKWDQKKKKFVGVNQDSKTRKIKTESGVWIPASYKSGRYAQWKEKNKIDENYESSDESEDDSSPLKKKDFMKKRFPNTHWGRHNEKLQLKRKSELKKPEQILKARKLKEREEARKKRKQLKRRK